MKLNKNKRLRLPGFGVSSIGIDSESGIGRDNFIDSLLTSSAAVVVGIDIGISFSFELDDSSSPIMTSITKINS